MPWWNRKWTLLNSSFFGPLTYGMHRHQIENTRNSFNRQHPCTPFWNLKFWGRNGLCLILTPDIIWNSACVFFDWLSRSYHLVQSIFSPKINLSFFPNFSSLNPHFKELKHLYTIVYLRVLQWNKTCIITDVEN